jgi:KRAB domain-containing zinc finger protein
MHCTKFFTSKNGLFIHTRSHTEEEPYSCDQCPKRFVSASNLRDHRMIHWREKTTSKIKPFTCMHCTKSFTSKNGLFIHTRSHTGEKPYGCDQYPERFAYRGALRYHKMTHPLLSSVCKVVCKPIHTENSHENSYW